MTRPNQVPRPNLRKRTIAAGLWFLQEFTYRGRTVVVAALLLASLSAAGMLAWKKWSPAIAGQERYLVTADRIRLNPPPAWLQKPIATEALEDAGLSEGLSLLDPDLAPRLCEALELHPWVHRVRRVEKRYPARVEADVDYRQPIAAVQVRVDGPDQEYDLSPVDEHAIRLPAADLPRAMLLRLPRVSDAGQLPLVGQPFEGPKMAGALALIRCLQGAWGELHLVSVVPVERPEIRSEEKFYLYDLISKGGTLIHWGAAPGLAPPDEAPAETKLARLRAYVDQHGPLDTIDAPRVINIRHDLEVTPHIAGQRAVEPQ